MFFVLNLTLSLSAWAAFNPVTGTITRQDKKVYVSGNSQCATYLLQTQNKEAAASLHKLSTGDFITASGFYQNSDCIALVSSIDYVGLKRLLGHWYAENGMLAVTDFNRLEFYPFSTQKAGSLSLQTSEPIRYRYSVTPSNGREWIMFLSDAKRTTFASLQLNSKNVSLRVYDAETGEPVQTLRFSKWDDLK